MFKTRVTELLGIEYPIIAGGMLWVSRAELAAAVSEAGGLGIITSANFTSGEELRQEVRKAKSLTSKPIGVNISLFPATRPLPNEEFVKVVVGEKVAAVETSGVRTPDEFIAPLRQAGVKIVHKCAAVRHAARAERIGADAVVVVGFENGGALGMDDIPTMVLVPATVQAVKIPVLAGGGIADGRGLAAALALGAEGVVMGTRFIAVKESPAHPTFKEWMLRAKETDLAVVERSIGLTHRSLKNKATERLLEMEARGASLDEVLTVTRGENYRRTIIDGELDAGMAYCGLNVGIIHDIPTAKELIERMVSEARVVASRLNAMVGR
ncbi:MAG: nitronate monooxygenase [Chloroflexota bacterium]